MRFFAFLALPLAVAACTSSSTSDDETPAPSPSSAASTVSLPELDGDCLSYFKDDGSRASVDIGALGLEASNCSDGDSICLLVASKHPFAMLSLTVPLDLFELEKPIVLTQHAPRTKLSVHVRDTQYLAVKSGITRGSIAITKLDLDEGSVDVRFDGVALGGEDSVFAGAFRCSLDGTLTIRGLRRSELGAQCVEDHECGGALSGRVCGEGFTCAHGCHDDSSCPLGSLCENETCSASTGATSDEKRICEKACHDRAFFHCVTNEAVCKQGCSTSERASVRAFNECNESSPASCKANCELHLDL